MVLFDWSARLRKKWAEEDYEKGRMHERREWQAWAQRLLEAKERGEDFDEPPPLSPKRRRSQITAFPHQINAKPRRAAKKFPNPSAPPRPRVKIPPLAARTPA